MTTETRNVRWFAALRLEDVPLVGGKNASLGELYAALGEAGVRVPNGFALTADAYRDALTAADAWPRLHALLDGLDVTDVALLARAGAAGAADRLRRHRHRCAASGASPSAYRHAGSGIRRQRRGRGAQLGDRRGPADRQLRRPARELSEHQRRRTICSRPAGCCFASLFTDRAIVYRVNNGFDHFKVALSVGVMKMVRSDMASSGVIFTLDTESGFRDVVFITGAYGLGENVVQGKVDPDEFYVHKPTFLQGHRAVLRRSLGQKQFALRLAEGHVGSTTRDQVMTEAARSRFCIDDAEVLTLADYAIRIEEHYSAQAGHPVPMDIEWAKDAADGRLYIVQARPETVASRRTGETFESYALTGERQGAGQRQGGRREDRHRRGAGDRRRRGSEGLPARRGAGGELHQPRLGAGDEDRRRHRHRPRRAHLPRGDRGARTRRAGGGRQRGGDQRRCAPASASPSPAPAARSARCTTATCRSR